MPQEFNIVRCYACKVFNVDIVKKSTVTWQCKVCGEKQSVKHVYGRSQSARECRQMVQQLNQERGKFADEEIEQYVDPDEPDDEVTEEKSKLAMNGTESRWSKYLFSSNDQ